MTGDTPGPDELRRRQRDEELAEREAEAEAEPGADADRHRRRAEKAAYLREKLEERERADREAGIDEE
jgi:hypothetical protein